MLITHNLPALLAANNMYKKQQLGSKATEKLSSGLRINGASDDAAGLAISEKMRAQIRGLNQAGRNIQDGMSLAQTAEGGLAQITENLQRMRELAVQAADETLTSTDREDIQDEVSQLIEGSDQIAHGTEFNQIKLLDNTNYFQQISSDNSTNVAAYNYENVLFSTPVGSSGNFQFATNMGYPTTEADDNQTLVFGSGGTSVPAVNIGGTVYSLSSQSITPTIQDNGSLKTVFQVPGRDVEITQKVQIVQDKYEIRYSVKNNSASAENIGIMFHIDTKLGNDDAAPFIVNGASVTNETKYVGAAVPDSFLVYNQNTGVGANAQIQAQGILKGTSILEAPSAFGIGHYNSVSAWNWVPSGSVGDSGYSVWWDPRVVNAGESFEVNTFYGLSVPPTIDNPTETTTPTVRTERDNLVLQVGPNAGNQFRVQLSDVRSETLKIATLKVEPAEEARKALGTLDSALGIVLSERSKFGAYQNSLEHIFNNTQNYMENLQSAESRIRDTDMAKEMVDFSKNNILTQAAQAMLAQANQQPQQVLSLLR